MNEGSSAEIISLHTKTNSELIRIRKTARHLLHCAYNEKTKYHPEKKDGSTLARYNAETGVTQGLWETYDGPHGHEYDRLGINMLGRDDTLVDPSLRPTFIISIENRHLQTLRDPRISLVDSTSNVTLYGGDPTLAAEHRVGGLDEANIMAFSERFYSTLSVLGLERLTKNRSSHMIEPATEFETTIYAS